MNELPKIISKERFLNAFKICKDYCELSENILDINFRLIQSHLLQLTEKQVSSFYDSFIKTELVYGLPELHSCDLVTVPKKSTGVREYRFFSTFSMILYNAVGLTFVDSCNDVIKGLNFNKKKVFPFYPTKFQLKENSKDESDKWYVKNNYKTEFKKYQETLDKVVSSNTAVLQLDLTQYFESIIHEKLIQLIYKYSNKSILSKNNLDEESPSGLEFYFECLMCRRFSIPQGRKNFVSDYLGYLYLVPFDMEIEKLCSGYDLKFKGMIRYVDDITLVFDKNSQLDSVEAYRQLLEIESKVINWFLHVLGLSTNPSKTSRKIINSQEEKVLFIEENKKSTSGLELVDDENNDSQNESESGENSSKKLIKDYFDEFISVIEKFKFPKHGDFKLEISKNDRETLKLIYDKKGFQNYLLKKDNIRMLKSTLSKIEVELTVDYINMLIVLFFLKNKKKKYAFESFFDSFLKDKLKFDDKRHVHIVHILMAQNGYDSKFINNQIRKSSHTLLNDNYGKYLMVLSNNHKHKEKYDVLNEPNCYLERISYEFSRKPPYQSHYLFNAKTEYQKIIQKWIKNITMNKAASDQLKNFVLYRRQKKWDLAFNHLHNLFHETCKILLRLNDTATVKDIIKLSNIELEEELIINKFYNRRNFNLISHPSQKNTPAEKVNKKDLLYFENRILCILLKLMD